MNESDDSSIDQDALISDAALVQKLEQRDRAAFRTIYDRYFDLVSTICSRVCGQSADANIVVSVVFVEIWDFPNRFRPERGTFRTYIGLLARSRAIDHVRRANTQAKNNQRSGRDLGHHSNAESQTLDPLELVSRNEIEQRVREVLQSLPAELYSVLYLTFYEGRSQREIAEELNLPLGTVKSRVRRALNLLADRMRLENDLRIAE